ncbi:MAG: cytochrome c [Pseudomonadota bacterium]
MDRLNIANRSVICLLQNMILVGISLFSLPALSAELPHFSSGKTFIYKDGESLYKATCQGCHMSKGEGASTGAGMYPALANNPKLAGAAYPIYIILHGRNGMPSFAKSMNDDQIAAVVGYIRTHMGNHYPDQVKPEDVKNSR